MSGGGAERSMAILANGLAQIGKYDVTLLSLQDSFGYDLDSSIKKISFNRNYRFGQLEKFLTMIPDALRLKRIISDNYFEVVLAFQYRSNFINVLAKIFGAKHRCIISDRSYTIASFGKGIPRFIARCLVKYLYNRADLITCNGSDTKVCLENDFAISKPIYVIPNAYDRQAIAKAADAPVDSQDAYLFERGKKTLIYVSRIGKTKGHADLIRAFAKMNHRQDHQLILVGTGSAEDDYKSLTRQLGLQEDVFFLGFKKDPYRYVKRSDVFVMPSYFEGYPNALAEALICDVACVAYDFKAGAKDLLGDNKAGTIVPLGDIDALAAAIVNAPNKSANAYIYSTSELVSAYMKILHK